MGGLGISRRPRLSRGWWLLIAIVLLFVIVLLQTQGLQPN
jgi:Tfp pilus assembly protein PilX